MHFSRKGLTLIEVIVSIGLISILTLSVTLISLAIFRSWQGESGYSNQRLMLTGASEAMIRDLRGALRINSVEERQINVWLDVNDNGLEESPDEQVVFSWSGVSGAGLFRSQGLNFNQEVLKNLDGFSVFCLGQDNQVLDYPIADISLIRALKVNLTSKVSDESINLTLSVLVRNL